jgi:Paraquat-inducible protein A
MEGPQEGISSRDGATTTDGEAILDMSNNNTTQTVHPTTTSTAANFDDDDDRSVESVRLRESFIRLTTQATLDDDGDDDQYNSPRSNSNNNGYRMLRNFTTRSSMGRTGPPSLAQAPTTPPWLTLLLPLACVITHILFAYGQWAPMWRLSLTAEDINLWANATTPTAQFAFDQLGLNHTDHKVNYQVQNNHTVETFTYGFAVQELWEAKGMPGVFLPRVAALLLILFSGIWPHVKLVLLQHSWSSSRLSQVPNQRTKTLGWLALLGKWSLADVLAICIMVGVLNLEWSMDPPEIKKGVLNHLHVLVNLAQQVWDAGQVCSMVLPFDATDCGGANLSFKEKVECFTCKKFVNAAYHDPQMVEDTGKVMVEGIDVSGHGTIRLSVVGMNGIYAFCAAVICSVLLSAVVDWYNYKHIDSLRKHAVARRLQGADTATEVTALEETPSAHLSIGDSYSLSDASEPLLMDTATTSSDPQATSFEPLEIMEDDASVFSNFVQRTTSAPSYTGFQCHHILPLVTLGFVGLAIYLPSMERKVGGAIPKYLKEILVIDFNKSYSLAMLQDMTGAAGGMDWLLMATFALFCVLGPLLRAILVVLVAMSAKSSSSWTEGTQRIRSLMVAASNVLAAFCAWEVFLVAMIMVELLMPSVTNTILNTRACEILSGDGTSCLVVSYERVHIAFACLVLGWILVGGLSLHVSMEDNKERHMELNNGQVRTSAATYRPLPVSDSADHEVTGLPPMEIFSDNPTDSFILNHQNHNMTVGASMIEEQLV